MTLEFSNSTPVAEVPSLTIEVTEETITEFIALSDRLPLIVLFSGVDAASVSLRATIENLTEGFEGKILSLVVDPENSPTLAQAFEVTAIPALFGLLKGQPAPLFTGDQDSQQVKLVLDRVLQVAADNQLVGKVVKATSGAESELSETHKAAFEKIDQGDYQGAIELYRLALRENPNDSLAEAGLAQVQLLLRLEGKTIDSLLLPKAEKPAEQLAKADALIATGQAKAGFEILLDLFAASEKEQREEFRLRLLELFLVVGIDSPEVAEARKKLSLLLF
ncbi:MAG: tetratricopeptide repeat protein [Actinomycetota bacterium]